MRTGPSREGGTGSIAPTSIGYAVTGSTSQRGSDATWTTEPTTTSAYLVQRRTRRWIRSVLLPSTAYSIISPPRQSGLAIASKTNASLPYGMKTIFLPSSRSSGSSKQEKGVRTSTPPSKKSGRRRSAAAHA